jgi:hypothetical protein
VVPDVTAFQNLLHSRWLRAALSSVLVLLAAACHEQDLRTTAAAAAELSSAAAAAVVLCWLVCHEVLSTWLPTPVTELLMLGSAVTALACEFVRELSRRKVRIGLLYCCIQFSALCI